MQGFVYEGEELKNLSKITNNEWLVTNSLGSYASGTVSGILTRKYHGLLVARLDNSLNRQLLVSKVEEKIKLNDETFDLFSNQWGDGSITPRGFEFLTQFKLEGTTPVWSYKCGSAVLEKRIWMAKDENTTYINYYYAHGQEPLQIDFEVFVNNRSFHNVCDPNSLPSFDIESVEGGIKVSTNNFSNQPFFILAQDIDINEHRPLWFYNYKLKREEERNYQFVDSNYSATSLSKELSPKKSITLVLTTNKDVNLSGVSAYQEKLESDISFLDRCWSAKQKTASWVRYLELTSRSFVVNKELSNSNDEKTVIAGYPWYQDRTKELLISLNGLTINEPDLAKSILNRVSMSFNKGLLPSILSLPESDSDEESGLWFFHALCIYHKRTLDIELIRELFIKLDEVIHSLVNEQRCNVNLDKTDHLLKTKKGKPVALNALWYNAIKCMMEWTSLLGLNANKEYYLELSFKVRDGFAKFKNPEKNSLFNKIDCPVEGKDESIRPEQLLALSLRHSPIAEEVKVKVLETCENNLLTPYGLRSLSYNDINYLPTYLQPNINDRELASDNGSCSLWILSHFAMAHYQIHKDKKKALSYFDEVPNIMKEYGIGQVGELFDGNKPHLPNGALSYGPAVAEILSSCQYISTQA